MKVELTDKLFNVLVSSLRCSKFHLKSQEKKYSDKGDMNKLSICKAQLQDVESVLEYLLILEEMEGNTIE